MKVSETTKSYAKNMLFFVGKAVPDTKKFTKSLGLLFSITGGIKGTVTQNFMGLGANIASGEAFFLTAPQLSNISNTLILTSNILNAVETVKSTNYNNARSTSVLQSSLAVGMLLLNTGFLLGNMFYGCDTNSDCDPSTDTLMMKCAAGMNLVAMGINCYLEKRGISAGRN